MNRSHEDMMAHLKKQNKDLLNEQIDTTQSTIIEISAPTATITIPKNIFLSDEEKERYLHILEEANQYGSSVTEQNSKTESMYLGFAQSLGLPPYPITETLGVGFLQYLADTGKYCYNTLSTVTYQSLIRLNVSRTGSDIKLTVRESMRRKLREIRLSPSTKQARGGMEPLILDDLKRIIMNMKDVDPLKPGLSSLFLFALYTGARANTCAGVYFNHFSLLKDKGVGNFTLGVTLHHVKGNTGKAFCLTLGGNPNVRKDIDVIYWLNVHFINTVGIDLQAYTDLAPSEKDTERFSRPVWPWTEDGMTQHLKRRMAAAGFPTAHHGFHSLRAGFLASVILNNLNTTESMDGVLSKAAIVTGWQPYSRVELGYIKETTRAAIVTTDLVGATKTPHKTKPAAVDEDLPNGGSQLSTYDFHDWAQKDPPKDDRSYVYTLKSSLIAKVKTHLSTSHLSEARGNSLWFTALRAYGSSLLERKGKEGEAILAAFTGTKWNCYVQVARRDINHRLISQPQTRDGIIEELFSCLEATGRFNETLSSESSDSTKQSHTPKHRQRNEWTPSEDQLLIKNIEDGLPLSDISKGLPKHTPGNIRAHLKLINRNREKQGLPLFQLPMIHQTHTSSLIYNPHACETPPPPEQPTSQTVAQIDPDPSSSASTTVTEQRSSTQAEVATSTPPPPLFTTVTETSTSLEIPVREAAKSQTDQVPSHEAVSVPVITIDDDDTDVLIQGSPPPAAAVPPKEVILIEDDLPMPFPPPWTNGWNFPPPQFDYRFYPRMPPVAPPPPPVPAAMPIVHPRPPEFGNTIQLRELSWADSDEELRGRRKRSSSRSYSPDRHHHSHSHHHHHHDSYHSHHHQDRRSYERCRSSERRSHRRY